jgi:hypothetical protein
MRRHAGAILPRLDVEPRVAEPEMEQRRLGASGLTVSVLSFGTMTIGGLDRFGKRGNLEVATIGTSDLDLLRRRLAFQSAGFAQVIAFRAAALWHCGSW